MTVSHPTAVRNGLCSNVTNQLDQNTPPAKIVLQTSGSVPVATLTMAIPAFGPPTTGTATAGAIGSDTNAAGGVIAKGEMRQGNNTPIVLFSVTTTGGGGDLEMNSVTVSPGQTVQITALTYSAPP